MKVLSPGLKLNVRGFGRAWPAVKPVGNVDLLTRHPDTTGKPVAVLEELGARITRAFGFKFRYMTHLPGAPFAAGEETSESLSLKAVCKAVGEDKDIEAFVLGSTTTRRYSGSQATSILGKLGVCAPAYEVKAGCSTSLASLHFAQALFAQGYDNVLVSCAETLSKVANPEVRETWFGLADGGSAVWFERAKGKAQFEVLKSFYSTDGQHIDLYTTPGELPPRLDVLEAGGYYIAGDSSQLRVLAKQRYLEMIEALLPAPADRARPRWVISHQVSRSLTEEVCKETGLSGELIWHAEEFGNIGGSSVLFALVQGLESGCFKPGDEIFMMSVGGGLSFAAQLWRAC